MDASARAGKPARVRYVQPDGRGVVKWKWKVAKGDGPAVWLAERLQKVLLKLGWPVEYSTSPGPFGQGDRVRFWLMTGPDTPEFLRAFPWVCQIESRRTGVPLEVDGSTVSIVGPHRLDVRIYLSGGKAMVTARIKREWPVSRPLDDPPF